MNTIEVRSGVCDQALHRAIDVGEIIAFLLKRLKCLNRMEVCEGKSVTPADEWLLRMDSMGLVEWKGPQCPHRRTMAMSWPTEHLVCMECGEVVK